MATELPVVKTSTRSDIWWKCKVICALKVLLCIWGTKNNHLLETGSSLSIDVLSDVLSLDIKLLLFTPLLPSCEWFFLESFTGYILLLNIKFFIFRFISDRESVGLRLPIMYYMMCYILPNIFTAKISRIILNDKALLYSGLFWKF